jgi:hypothetical protein
MRKILSEDNTLLKVDDAACCAIGSVDDISVTRDWWDYSGVYEMVDRAKRRLEQEFPPMGVLSKLFENVARRESVKQAQATCVAFIKDHFPETLEINIDGAIPKPQYKVVSESSS